MKRRVIAGLLGCLLTLSMAVFAEDKPVSFWDSMRKKIETITPKKQLGANKADGGVRGEATVAYDYYWKGEIAVTQQELEAFNKALALGVAGNMAQAKIEFESFVKIYPNSSLRKDADQALVVLKGK